MPVKPISPPVHKGLRQAELSRDIPRQKSTVNLAKAVAAHLKHDSAAALEMLEPVSADSKDLPETLAARAYLLADLKRYEEAVAAYEQLLALRPHHAEGQYQCGACLYRLGRFDQALARASRSAELDPARTDSHLLMGICLLHLKRPEEARDAFTKCLEKSPGMEAALLGKGAALQLTWEFEEAMEVYRQILRRNPQSEEVLVNLIALGMQRKDYALVTEHAQALLAFHPEEQTALEGLSAAAFAEERFEEAAGYYSRLVELNSQNYDYWFNLGVTYQKCGKPMDAATAYHNAAALRPDVTAAHINAAAVYREMGDLQAARESFERALRIAPERDDLRYHRAVVVEEQGLLEDAEALYAELGERDSADVENAWFRLGYLKLLRGDYGGAVDALRVCLEKRPAWSGAEINLALAHWKLGEHEQSRKVLEALLAREPNSVEAVRGLAANALDQNDPAEALKWHLRLHEMGDHSSEVLHNTGLLLQQTGDVEGAIRFYRDAIDTKPDFAEALLNLGHALQSAGHADEARSSWVRALEIRPDLAHGYFLTND